MSRGFVKEYDDQWLHEIAPTLSTLLKFLTNENNGFSVYEKKVYQNEKGKDVYEMSNGLSYSVNEKNQWYVLDDIV